MYNYVIYILNRYSTHIKIINKKVVIVAAELLKTLAGVLRTPIPLGVLRVSLLFKNTHVCEIVQYLLYNKICKISVFFLFQVSTFMLFSSR